MALNLCRITRNAPLLYLYICRTVPAHYSKLEIDVLDNFTSQLLEKKLNKWYFTQRKNESFLENSHKLETKPPTFGININDMELLMQNALKLNDWTLILQLTQNCINHQKCLNFKMLVKIVSVCAQEGQKDLICEVQKLSKIYHNFELERHSNFEHFIAEAIWVRGDIVNSLNLFEEIYDKNVYLRSQIRHILRRLIRDIISKHSEGGLRILLNFSEDMFGKYKDVFFLSCVWQACFLSEWYTDQEIAFDLIHKNTILCQAIVNRIPYVVFVSLKCHRTEVVYRLLEIFISCQMTEQCTSILTNLMDYQFRNGNFQSCAEIITWAVNNNISLPKNPPMELINILLDEPTKRALTGALPDIPKERTFNYKF